MKVLVLLVLMIMSIGFWLAIEDNRAVGKLPSDEVVTLSQERNKVTGELLNVETIKCLLCGEVISYVQFHKDGTMAFGYKYSHHCGQYKARSLVRRTESSFGEFHLNDWLEKWQRRLRVRR